MKETENLYAEHYVKYKLMNYTLVQQYQKKKQEQFWSFVLPSRLVDYFKHSIGDLKNILQTLEWATIIGQYIFKFKKKKGQGKITDL